MPEAATVAPPTKPAPAIKPSGVTFVPDAPLAIVKRYHAAERDVLSADRHQAGTHWRHTVSPTVPYAEVLKETYWAHVAGPKDMRIGNFIEVVAADNSYVALLYVLDVGSVWAKVGEVWKKEFEAQSQAGDREIAGFAIKWDQLRKHHVVRTSDNEVVLKGFESNAVAYQALLDHARKMSR